MDWFEKLCDFCLQSLKSRLDKPLPKIIKVSQNLVENWENEGDLWSIFYKHQQENLSLSSQKEREKERKKPPHFETQPSFTKNVPKRYLKVNTWRVHVQTTKHSTLKRAFCWHSTVAIYWLRLLDALKHSSKAGVPPHAANHWCLSGAAAKKPLSLQKRTDYSSVISAEQLKSSKAAEAARGKPRA